MNKFMAFLALASLGVIIGSAGALELATIGIGQALLQMTGGLIGLGVSGRYLAK